MLEDQKRKREGEGESFDTVAKRLATEENVQAAVAGLESQEAGDGEFGYLSGTELDSQPQPQQEEPQLESDQAKGYPVQRGDWGRPMSAAAAAVMAHAPRPPTIETETELTFGDLRLEPHEMPECYRLCYDSGRPTFFPTYVGFR